MKKKSFLCQVACLATLLFSFLLTGCASSETPEDHVMDWKDENLKNAMIEVTGITDRDIMFSDVCDLYTLTLEKKGITDISALGSLTKLGYLELDSNAISDIQALENMPNLQILWLGGNPLTDISVLGKLGSLEVLGLSNNEITDIRVLQNLTNLKTLYLQNNPVTDYIPVSHVPNLMRSEENSEAVTEPGIVSDTASIPSAMEDFSYKVTEDNKVIITGYVGESNLL